MAEAPVSFPAPSRDSIVEPFAVPDTLITDVIAADEISANLYRVTLGTANTCVMTGTKECIVSAKLLMSGDMLARFGFALANTSRRKAVRLRMPASNAKA